MFQDDAVLHAELADVDPRSYPNSGAGSPWDGLLHVSPLTARAAGSTSSDTLLTPECADEQLSRLPKLVPEVEEGNIEYKLKLLDPSPARFARLVTQLKWRLLEGQGQAYYEIGVADSGLLIGLAKAELERSIETLEEMAGEIGASVIIVKEVAVPDALVRSAERVISRGEATPPEPDGGDDGELWRPRLGAWDRRSKRAEVLKSVDSFSSSTSVTTLGTDTETEADEVASDDDALATSPPVKTFQALDFDDLLALGDADAEADEADAGLFPFDPEVSPETFAKSEPGLSKQSFESALLIASVFKLRPRRRRPPSTHVKLDKRQQKLDARTNYRVPARAGAAFLDAAAATETHLTKCERRRIARDRRREVKRQALLAGVAAVTSALPEDVAQPVVVSGKEVTVVLDGSAVLDSEVANLDLHESASEIEEVFEATSASSEPRLIVEALVVRKLSVGAATYGDFGFRFDFE